MRGLTNGLVVTIGKITPFVATLGMMSIARGFTLIYTKGYPISGFSPDFRFIGGGYLFGCPIPIVIFLAVVVIAYVILAQTRVGRYTYAIGGKQDSGVILSGINWPATLVYVIAGASAALSALIPTSRLNSAEPIAGLGRCCCSYRVSY